MTFIWPWMLLSLAAVPVFIGLYLNFHRNRIRLPDAGPFAQLRDQDGNPIGNRRHIPIIFYFLGTTLLLFALSRPEAPVSLPRVEGTIILAFDVSGSMLADDFEPNRIEAAKAAARSFVENQPETVRIGIVAFSNGGLIVQPPTNETLDLLDAIDRLDPQGGTSLGQGIFTSLNAITGGVITIDPEDLEDGEGLVQMGSFPSSIIVVLSDGEHTTAPNPVDMAQIAAEASVRIFPVGLGSREGTVIELDGFNVVTQLNEPVLQEIAALTNGQYLYADDAEALAEIYDNIDLQLTVRGEQMEITAVLAGISLLLFLIGGTLNQLWFGRIP